jgi:co-chaperonin GroES (HSP10)
MNCKIKPCSGRLIIEEREAVMKVGSIVLPEELRNRSQNEATEGKIIAMDKEAFEHLQKCDRPKIGYVVHFIKYDGIGKVYNKKHYRIISDKSVWGISKNYIELEEELIDNG